MGKYNFKDKYYDPQGLIIEDEYKTSFYAYLGNGDGSRENPASASIIRGARGGIGDAIIIAGGRIKTDILISKANGVKSIIKGQGIGKTILTGKFISKGISGSYWNQGPILTYQDITFEHIALGSEKETNSVASGSSVFTNCEFKEQVVFLDEKNTGHSSFADNIFHFIPSSLMTKISGNNTFINATGSPLKLSRQLHHNCQINLSDSIIKDYASFYFAFNDCRFQIGSETEYTKLKGNTAEELKVDFISRCKAQNIELESNLDGENTILIDNWVFTTNSVMGYVPYRDSELHRYEQEHNISFGFSSLRLDPIKISTKKNSPNSFISDNASDKLVFQEHSISFGKDIDITKIDKYEATSGICWLGAKKEIIRIITPESFQKEYGVLLDSQSSLLTDSGILPEEPKIEEGELYFVRSRENQPATISYNLVDYDTNVSTSKNYFRGINNIKEYTSKSGNPIVYRLNDIMQFYTIAMRIVDEIPPADNTDPEKLDSKCWYFVEHINDQKNITDYVTYKDIDYYVGSSFLTDDNNLTYKTVGNIRLRRCWIDNYDENDTTYKDYNFWMYRQKPKWFHVIPDDPRCFLEGNSSLSIEMQKDDKQKEYIASGHPDFYNNLRGKSGFFLPDFRIRGTYAQFKLVINTQALVNNI